MKVRQIGENIKLLYDVLLYAKNRNIPGLLSMVHFEKAFDSDSWPFIDKALSFKKKSMGQTLNSGLRVSMQMQVPVFWLPNSTPAGLKWAEESGKVTQYHPTCTWFV